MANKVLSIEIAQRLTRICEVDYKTKNSKVYSCFTMETPENVLDDGMITNPEVFGAAMKQELEKRKIKTKQAVFTIASTRIANRETSIPAVKENRIQSLIEANATDYFPVDITGYQLAYNILDTVEAGDSKQHKLLVLAAPKVLLDSYFLLATLADLSVVAIDYTGNSIISAVKNVCTEDVTMIIRIDEKTSLLTVLKDRNIILQRNIPNGAEELIHTMMELSERDGVLSYTEAIETLRTKSCIQKTFDSSKQEELDFEKSGELTESLSNLSGSILRVVDYYNSRNNDAQIQRILLTGFASDFSGLSKLLTTEIGMKVATITEVEGIDLSRFAKDEGFFVGAYLSCIGAAINPVDFIPEEHKAKKKKGKTKTEKGAKPSIDGAQIALAVLIVGIVVAAVLAIVPVTRFIVSNQKNKTLKAKEAELLPAEEIYTKYVSCNQIYSDVTNMYQGIEVQNDGLHDFLLEMEEKMPTDINVLSFDSNNLSVTMNINVPTKEDAGVIIQEFRSFDSLINVTTRQITETTDEMGVTTINFAVECTYRPLEAVSADTVEAETAPADDTAVEEEVEQ